MENVSLIEHLAQAGDSEVGEAFESFMRTAARTALAAALFEEVNPLFPFLSRGDGGILTEGEKANS